MLVTTPSQRALNACLSVLGTVALLSMPFWFLLQLGSAVCTSPGQRAICSPTTATLVAYGPLLAAFAGIALGAFGGSRAVAKGQDPTPWMIVAWLPFLVAGVLAYATATSEKPTAEYLHRTEQQRLAEFTAALAELKARPDHHDVLTRIQPALRRAEAELRTAFPGLEFRSLHPTASSSCGDGRRSPREGAYLNEQLEADSPTGQTGFTAEQWNELEQRFRAAMAEHGYTAPAMPQRERPTREWTVVLSAPDRTAVTLYSSRSSPLRVSFSSSVCYLNAIERAALNR